MIINKNVVFHLKKLKLANSTKYLTIISNKTKQPNSNPASQDNQPERSQDNAPNNEPKPFQNNHHPKPNRHHL